MVTRTIAIMMGGPAGIDPEIVVKALREDELNGAPLIVVGCLKTLQRLQTRELTDGVTFRAIEQVADARFTPDTIHMIDEPLTKPGEPVLGTVQVQVDDLAYRCAKWATELAMKGGIHAIATAPLDKEALHLSGHNYPGHTELLATLTENRDCAVTLYTDKLEVIHVSTHVALHKFPDTLNGQHIEVVIGIADAFLERIDFAHPRIAVAGVSPHAGKNGLFGDEEIHIVEPAIENMRAEGIDVHDPYPSDTVFSQACEGWYNTVVTVYYDQGHIPPELLGLYDGINITVGLPFIRTSADHSTAFDIVWTGRVESGNMAVPIKLTMQLV